MGLKIILTVLLVVIGLLLFYFGFYFIGNDFSKNLVNEGSIFASNDIDLSGDEPNDLDIVPGEDSSGGSAGGGGGGGIFSNFGCELFQVSYSAVEFSSNAVCNQYQGQVCVDKTVNCSIEINNLDDELSGVFEINFRFFESGIEENIIFSDLSDFFLDSFQGHIFESSFNVQSSGIQGSANKNLVCFYDVLRVPERRIC